MNNRKLIITISCFVVVVIVAASILISIRPNESSSVEVEVNTVLVKENVIVIDESSRKKERPYQINESQLFYKNKPSLNDNDIVVSDVTEEAPNGYMRKVLNVVESNGIYVVETTPATLLDVFEELDLSATIPLSNNKEIYDVSANVGDALSVADSLFGFGVIEANALEGKFDINKNIELSMDEISVEGEVGVSATLELNINIKNEEITWSTVATDKIYGDLFVGSKANAEKEFKKNLANLEGTVTIMAGAIPIVVSNEVSFDVKGKAAISGELGANIDIDVTQKNGFIYTSADGEVKEINENNSFSGGLECNTGTKGEGELKAGIFINLTTLLYDCTGSKIGVGVEGKVEGELEVSDETLDTEEKLYGKVSASIYPKLYGNIIVNIPGIDLNLGEVELFLVEFKPFLEKKFEYGKSAKASKLQENINTEYLMRILGTLNLMPYNITTNQAYYGNETPPKYNINDKELFTIDVWRDYIQTVVITQYAFEDVDFYKVISEEPKPTEKRNSSGGVYAYYQAECLEDFLSAVDFDMTKLKYNEYSYYDESSKEYVIAVDGLGGFVDTYYCEFVDSKVDEKNNQLVVRFIDYNKNFATNEESLELKEVYLSPVDNSIGYVIEKVETIDSYTSEEVSAFVLKHNSILGTSSW